MYSYGEEVEGGWSRRRRSWDLVKCTVRRRVRAPYTVHPDDRGGDKRPDGIDPVCYGTLELTYCYLLSILAVPRGSIRT